MKPRPKAMLREFYAQALLCPEWLCLHCSYRPLPQGAGVCPPSRRAECLRWLGHQAGRLGATAPAPAPPVSGSP